jgi:hypothetical protein
LISSSRSPSISADFSWSGFYAYQPEDDQLNGVRIPPDGHRAAIVEIGPVLAYDMPEHDMTMKLKTATSIYSINTVEAWAVVFTLFKKF